MAARPRRCMPARWVGTRVSTLCGAPRLDARLRGPVPLRIEGSVESRAAAHIRQCGEHLCTVKIRGTDHIERENPVQPPAHPLLDAVLIVALMGSAQGQGPLKCHVPIIRPEDMDDFVL